MGHHGGVKIAVVQTASSHDKAANRDLVTRLVADAAAGKPDLVVLPEAMMADFASEGGSVGDLAEALDGDFVSTLRKTATEHGVAIVAGMFERSCDEARRTTRCSRSVRTGTCSVPIARSICTTRSAIASRTS
jgi:predicted amidohydrolase